MNGQLIRIGKQVVNLAMVSAAHWDGEVLYVYLVGGRFTSFRGEAADLVWRAIQSATVELGQAESSK